MMPPTSNMEVDGRFRWLFAVLASDTLVAYVRGPLFLESLPKMFDNGGGYQVRFALADKLETATF